MKPPVKAGKNSPPRDETVHDIDQAEPMGSPDSERYKSETAHHDPSDIQPHKQVKTEK